MVDEVAWITDSVGPGSIRILAFQDEIDVPLRDLEISVLGEKAGGACQQTSPVCARVDNSSLVMRSIGTAATLFRSLEILDIDGGVLRDRPQYTKPSRIAVDSMDLLEGFESVRGCGDERDSCRNRPVPCDPIKWVPPAVPLVFGASGVDEDFQEVYGPTEIFLYPGKPGETGEPHGVVGIGDGKALPLPEDFSCRREKCLGEDERSNGKDAHGGTPII